MENTKVKVSIIIPVYNVEAYLRECLDSVIEQSFREFEIICINDGSTDKSKIILEEYALLDTRIKIVDYPKNKGLSYARNKGLKIAKGKYIYFFDSDDILIKTAIENLYNIAEQNAVDGLLFDTKSIFENETLSQMFSKYKDARTFFYDGIFQGDDLFNQLKKNGDFDTAVWRQFWSKSFLNDNHIFFYEGILHEDHLFTLQAIFLAKKIKCVNESYHIYRRRVNSIMSNRKSHKNFEGCFITYCETVVFLSTIKLKKQYLKSVYEYLNTFYLMMENLYETLELDEKKEITFSKTLHELLYLGFKQKKGGSLCKTLSSTEIAELQQAELLLVYGAGIVSKDLMKMLDHIGIDKYYIVVSSCNDNEYLMGNKIHNINEFSNNNKHSVVLIAATAQYHEEIIEKLHQLGFNNYKIMI